MDDRQFEKLMAKLDEILEELNEIEKATRGVGADVYRANAPMPVSDPE